MQPHPNSDALQAIIAEGLITSEQALHAQTEADQTGRKTLQVLIDSGALTQADAIRVAAKQAGLGFVNLTELPITDAVAALLDPAQARRYTVMPISILPSGSLQFAVPISRANDLNLKDDLRRLTRTRVIDFVVAQKGDIEAKIQSVYSGDEIDDLTESASNQGAGGVAEADVSAMQTITEDSPAVKLVNALIGQAITERATDIHVEPGDQRVDVRFRIDDVLHDRFQIPNHMRNSVTSVLKIMAEMRIDEKRVGQDGRISYNHGGKKIDLRAATIPTVKGEQVVLRILDNSNAQMELSDLGFSDANYAEFAKSFRKPEGMILVTGPTGSGKSTTLYATLNQINSRGVKVLTVEDPVEYEIPGIGQVQTNEKAGVTFAGALRNFLRGNPDYLLVGEIRDGETAQTAMDFALTGHLVLSTLHTTNAPAAVRRLVKMGVEADIVGSTVNAVVAQRLCRRLCLRCRETYTPDLEALTEAQFTLLEGEPAPVLHRPVGCAHCASTGYRGMLGLHEVMTVNEEIEELISEGGSTIKIRQAALRNGMRLMRDDGFDKVRAGITSLDEVLRVVS